MNTTERTIQDKNSERLYLIYETFEKRHLCHCERSEAISYLTDNIRDGRVAVLLAMTV
jgi:hypothetical protein